MTVSETIGTLLGSLIGTTHRNDSLLTWADTPSCARLIGSNNTTRQACNPGRQRIIAEPHASTKTIVE
jgi:hypothetical protein